METIIQTIIETAQNLHWVEALAVFFSTIYVLLAAKGSVWCWVFGNIGCAFWAFASFEFYNLWVDALLQAFYIGMGFWGIYIWLYGGKEKSALPITTLPFQNHVKFFVIGIILTSLFGYFFDHYTPAAVTYLDSFTTIFAIVATFLTIKKIVESWLYWIIIDLLYVYIYSKQGALLFALLLIIWTIMAIFGYFKWRSLMKLGIKST